MLSSLVVCEGEYICVSHFSQSLAIVIVSLVCSACVVIVCVLGGVGCMLGPPGRAFCVFYFVTF